MVHAEGVVIVSVQNICATVLVSGIGKPHIAQMVFILVNILFFDEIIKAFRSRHELQYGLVVLQAERRYSFLFHTKSFAIGPRS